MYQMSFSSVIDIFPEEDSEFNEAWTLRASMPDETGDDDELVGVLCAIKINYFYDNTVQCPIESADAISDGAAAAVAAVWNEKKQEFNKNLKIHHGDLSILVIDCLFVMPNHRGKDLGLAMIKRCVDTIGKDTTVVIRPGHLHRLSHHMYLNNKEKTLIAELLDQEVERDVKKLKKHYAKIGFKVVPKTDYMYFDTSNVMGKIKEPELAEAP